MKLSPLEPIAAQHIASISRKLGLDVVLLRPRIEPTTLIILGNGTPDDYVMALVAWACNGEKAAFITRPKGTGIANAVRYLKGAYLPRAPRLRWVVLVVDRNGTSLPDITNEAQAALKQYGLEILKQEELADGWLKRCSCRWRPEAEIDILIVVNGLTKDQDYSKDCIEVHLLEIAKPVLDGDTISEVLSKARDEDDELRRVDPKRAWRLLDRDEQWAVFGLLKEEPNRLRSVFKQHCQALGEVGSSINEE